MFHCPVDVREYECWSASLKSKEALRWRNAASSSLQEEIRGESNLKSIESGLLPFKLIKRSIGSRHGSCFFFVGITTENWADCGRLLKKRNRETTDEMLNLEHITDAIAMESRLDR